MDWLYMRPGLIVFADLECSTLSKAQHFLGVEYAVPGGFQYLFGTEMVTSSVRNG